MKRTISAMEARRHFGEVLEGVHYRGDEVVIERNGKTMGVLIPASRYSNLERERERFLDLLRRTQEHTKDVPDDVIQREVEAAIRDVRRATTKKPPR